MAGDQRYPGHSEAFKRVIVGTRWPDADSQNIVRSEESLVTDLMTVTDDELVLLSRLTFAATVPVGAEIARRTGEAVRRNEEALRLNREAIDKSTAALVAFKQESATASNRLHALTRWLIAFTCAVVLLTVALVVHDLSR